MNIWIINQYINLPDYPGGTRHIDISRELVAKGHSVELFASGFNYVLHREVILGNNETRRTDQHDGIVIHWLRIYPYRKNNYKRFISMFSFYRALSTEVNRMKKENTFTKPDVIIGSSVHLLSVLAAYRLTKKLGSRFIMEVRDLWPYSIIALNHLSRFHPVIWFFGTLERFLYRKAEKIIVLPENAVEYIRKYTNESKVVWIPNSFSGYKFPEHKEHQQNERFIIMYAGAIGVPNDVITLVRAFKQLDGTGKYELHLIGDGVEKQRIATYIKINELEHVKMFNPVPKSQIYGLLQKADLLWAGMIDSPLYKYGFSFNKLFDYMAVKKPVILSAPYRGTLIGKSGGGFEINAHDPEKLTLKISEIKQMSKAEREMLGLKAYNYLMEHFTTEKITQKLIDEVLTIQK